MNSKTSFKNKKRNLSKGTNSKISVPLQSQNKEQNDESFQSEIKNIQEQQFNLERELQEITGENPERFKSFNRRNVESIEKAPIYSYEVKPSPDLQTKHLQQVQPIFKKKDNIEEQEISKENSQEIEKNDNQQKNLIQEKQENSLIQEKNQKDQQEDNHEEQDDDQIRLLEDVKNDPEDLKKLYNVFIQKSQLRYTEDPEINLLIITLKNAINKINNENQLLKKLNLEYEKKEVQQKQQLRQINSHIQELELEQQLLSEEPSKNVKFDLQDLDQRILQMEQSLKKATIDNAQERFLQELIDKNKEFQNQSEVNQGQMKKLKVNLTQLRTNLTNLNNQ